MRCNVIAQRITLQEHLGERQEQVLKDIEECLGDDERLKALDRAAVEAMLDGWLAGFTLVQPSGFFRDHPTNDSELVCSIESEKEFLLSTLEFFGLPKNYMEGAGHHATHGREKKDDKAAAARKRAAAKNQKAKKANAALAKFKKERARDKKTDEDAKPTHFDISIFQTCFKRFTACDGA